MTRLRENEAWAYAWFWVWFALVTAGTIFLYVNLAAAAGSAVASLSGIDTFAQQLESLWLEKMFAILAGILIWWRAIKVVVLQGAPFSFGILAMPGRQDEGRRGRNMSSAYIGDMDAYRNAYDGKFFYGAVFRAHANSDKLMRARLELLILAMPFGRTLKIHESRVFFPKEGHEDRARGFRLIADRYAKQTQTTSPEQFRRELVKASKAIADHLQQANPSNELTD